VPRAKEVNNTEGRENGPKRATTKERTLVAVSVSKVSIRNKLFTIP
jgi:hypothetical protein